MRRPIAPAWHTAVVLAILAVFGWFGTWNAARLRAMGGTHHLPLYLQTLAFEWLLLGLVIWGVRRKGGPVAAVLGPRWGSAAEFGRDLVVAAAFWIVSLFGLAMIAHVLGMKGQQESIKFLVPRGPLEMGIWVALSCTAGFCEEAIFRGYLQNQFAAWTRRPAIAIALSAMVFGAGHLYQGTRPAVVITCYGAMFGALAWWRQSVRPGMMAHAWQDTVSGIVGSMRLR